MSGTGEDAVRGYITAWLTTDSAERTALLERCWADDGVYTDPRNEAVGRGALAALIAGFQQMQPGAHFVLTSGVDEHHRMLRFGWRMLDAQNQPQLEGFDIGELDDSGRLKRITGFFGPFPPVPTGWPEHLVRVG
jgi:hypothetical protein